MAKTVGILTGGGDCPGLNAVIRAVVRRSDAAGWDCVGILEGWRGLVEGHFRDLPLRDVSGILPRGGTILGTTRTNPFKLDGGVEKVLAGIRDRSCAIKSWSRSISASRATNARRSSAIVSSFGSELLGLGGAGAGCAAVVEPVA